MNILGIESILVAVKFSRPCTCAVRYAVRLAHALGSKLVAVHVVSADAMNWQEEGEKLKQLWERVWRDCSLNWEMKDETHLTCLMGEPAAEIEEAVRRFKADLVVLGCHQDSTPHGVTRLGIIGLRILEGAPCPILLVPCAEECKPLDESR